MLLWNTGDKLANAGTLWGFTAPFLVACWFTFRYNAETVPGIINQKEKSFSVKRQEVSLVNLWEKQSRLVFLALLRSLSRGSFTKNKLLTSVLNDLQMCLLCTGIYSAFSGEVNIQRKGCCGHTNHQIMFIQIILAF